MPSRFVTPEEVIAELWADVAIDTLAIRSQDAHTSKEDTANLDSPPSET